MDGVHWTDWLRKSLLERVEKPRIAGLTLVIDDGMTSSRMRECLQITAEWIDFWMLSGCHAAVHAPGWLMDKVCLCQEYGVLPCPSGQAFAAALRADALSAYITALAESGLRSVLMADAEGRLSPRVRRDVIRRAHGQGLLVFAELSHHNGHLTHPDEVIRQVHSDLQAGADYLLLPLPSWPQGGREAEWMVEKQRLVEIMEAMGPLQNRLILKTRNRLLQLRLVEELGGKLNLADVNPETVTLLEALRRGMNPDWVWPEREVTHPEDAEGTFSPPRKQAAADGGHSSTGPVIWLDGRRGTNGRRR
ncbi:MAG: phosphosulfolactate synthase [Alicyclobacillus herbarius]|uniref:phosphosulfolactate synthase n=1 Tax=Alicyclobacillus herbarius TaxID=122960 RepID=UPI0023562C79|nr:phosphosulfolactate synthase [Alicyclobacillus herbarius]MCL6632242.1 phosphosulfolactate synthase [Alicyclobacillus herbarius]